MLALAVNGALILASSARAQDAAKPPAEKWHLKDSCRQVQLEPTAIVTSVRRTMTPTLIHANYTCSESSSSVQNSDRESIRLAAITDIVREEVTRKPVEDEIDRSLTKISPDNVFSTIGDAADLGIWALAAPAVPLAEAGALAPFHGVKTHQSYVRVFWTEDDLLRTSVFRLSPKDADSFLPRLSQATGKPWSVLRFDVDAENEHACQFLVHFTKPVDLGEISTSGGDYRFLTLTSSDARHTIYIFNTRIGLPQDAVSVLIADAYPLGSAHPWKIYLSPNASGSWCISEIHTNTERLKLHVCPAASDFPAEKNSTH